MAEYKLFDWQQAFDETYRSSARAVAENLPELVGAIAILVTGFIIAVLLRFLARKLTLAAEKLILRSARRRGITADQERTYNVLIGNIVFWSVLLFFFATSANLLGWEVFSNAVQDFLAYLPNLFAGLFIILGGLMLGRAARSLVESTGTSTRIERPEVPARIAQILVVTTAAMIGIDQLGINISFLTTALIVIAGVLISGIALAFAFGASNYVSNLIGAQMSHKHYETGQWIKTAQAEGYLLEITQTSLVLDTERGRAVVPASLLQQEVSQIITETGDSSGSLLGSLFRKKEDSDGSL